MNKKASSSSSVASFRKRARPSLSAAAERDKAPHSKNAAEKTSFQKVAKGTVVADAHSYGELSNFGDYQSAAGSRKRSQQSTLEGFGFTQSGQSSHQQAELELERGKGVETDQRLHHQNGATENAIVSPLDNLLARREAAVGLTKELTDILYQCETAKALLHYLPQEYLSTTYEVDMLSDDSKSEEEEEN